MEVNEFQRKYKQMNMLGKGNYGKVYKVKLNDGKEGKEAKYYVAKKMFLEGLSQDEIKSAFGQIQILEKINKEISSAEVPFVVMYKEFFRIENELIIIMEYCESGDLSTYIKNLKKNGQRINEQWIAFWFIQLLFGIKAIHSKNILHRDLKSANIFLTKNYSLKIGDFGISKVLQRSSAITCIGTPLYLSPEVCNNQPYGLSSDMWALGCILYEMCSLRYPFEASNMIVLAKKIVMDDVAPLPSYYSKQLNDIVMKMFVKDNKKRITADQIMKTPYIIKAISEYIKCKGSLDQIPITINLNQPTTESKSTEQTHGQQQDTMKTIKSVVQRTGGNQTLEFSQSLTPKERLKLKKQQQAKQKQQQVKRAIKEQAEERVSFAKQQKQRNLGQTGQFSKTVTKKLQIKAQNQNKAKSEIKFKAKQMEKMQTINLYEIQNTIQNLTIKQSNHENDFQDVPLPGNSSYIPINQQKTIKKSAKGKVEDKTIKKPSIQKEEQIVEQIFEDEELQEYYDEDFQDYVEQQEGEKQKKQQNILAYFQNQLGASTLSPTKRQKVQAAFQPLTNSRVQDKIKHLQSQCETLVGSKRFAELIKLFKEGKINMQKDKNKYTDKQKKVLFNIQQIVEYSYRT